MEDLFNPTENLIDEPTENLIDEPTENLIDEPTENLVDESIEPYTIAPFRRCFKRPPKPRLHAAAISPGDAIRACTVRPNERLSVLSSLNIQQEENMEPLPEFSRDMRHANRRYQKAVKDAQDEAERAKKEQKGNNGE